MKIKFYGVRGTAAVTNGKGSQIGINTSCVFVQTKEKNLVFDCGTGIAMLGDELIKERKIREIDLFISHIHLDHVLGLVVFKPLYDRDFTINIYGQERENLSIEQQLKKFFSPPLWPVTLESSKAKINFHTLTEYGTIYQSENINNYKKKTEQGKLEKQQNLKITTMKSNHPNICTLYRVEEDGKSFVYALDYEHDDKSFRALVEFCKGSDLTVYDASYINAEYESMKGFGHSTCEKAVEFQNKSESKRVLLSHIHYTREDAEILKIEKNIKNKNCFFAREGFVLEL